MGIDVLPAPSPEPRTPEPELKPEPEPEPELEPEAVEPWITTTDEMNMAVSQNVDDDFVQYFASAAMVCLSSWNVQLFVAKDKCTRLGQEN
jgi:hypothetical protein